MDLYYFLLFHTNKPRISNVIAKESCHISCFIAIHHTAQLFVSSVLKLCFSQECRTSDHFMSLYRISLHSMKNTLEMSRNQLESQAGLKESHKAAPAALPLLWQGQHLPSCPSHDSRHKTQTAPGAKDVVLWDEHPQGKGHLSSLGAQ